MNDISTLTKFSHPFCLEKRFQNDYEVVQILKKGENSSVYKVRNQLDNSLYAVKEIRFTVNEFNKKVLQKKINNVLKEVRLLAKLKSEYVVTYNHSWIEVKLKQSRELNQNVVYLENNTYKRVDSSENLSGQTTDSSSENKSPTNKILVNNFEYNIEDIENFVLYIQMELCKESLNDYIERRNQNIKRRVSDNFIKEKEKEILQMFISVCRAVDYLHSEEKIVHRDLKTKGIFFSDDGKIKVGNIKYAKEKFSKLSNASLNFDSNKLRNNKYEPDIYSLGLILFELAFPLQTGKERTSKYEEVKNGIIPSCIKDQSPLIYKLLEMMLSQNLKKRPSCKIILSFIQEYIKNVYKDNDYSSLASGRRRILSEDNETDRKLELFVKMDEEREDSWEKMWIKIVNDRLLLFSQKSSSKAIICYRMKECDFSGNFMEEKTSKKQRTKKSSSMNNMDEVIINQRKQLFDQLNFLIAIDHPYLRKCYIKCDSLLKSLDLFYELSNINSGSVKIDASI